MIWQNIFWVWINFSFFHTVPIQLFVYNLLDFTEKIVFEEIDSDSSMFDSLKPKIGCSSSITNRWTHLSLFNVRKNDVRVSSMSDLVHLVRILLCLILVCLKTKIGCLGSITNRWTCTSSFEVRKMMSEFVQCLMKWCSTHH